MLEKVFPGLFGPVAPPALIICSQLGRLHVGCREGVPRLQLVVPGCNALWRLREYRVRGLFKTFGVKPAVLDPGEGPFLGLLRLFSLMRLLRWARDAGRGMRLRCRCDGGTRRRDCPARRRRSLSTSPDFVALELIRPILMISSCRVGLTVLSLPSWRRRPGGCPPA